MSKALTNVYLSTFCKEIAMLTDAGIPAQVGVGMMNDDSFDKDEKHLLKNLYDALNEGKTFADALEHVGFFPFYMTRMIRIGETSGSLTESLFALSSHYERQERLRESIKSATLYPSILLVMMLGVILILIIQVLPIFNDVFGRMGARMSPFAQELLRFGDWLRAGSFVLIIILCVILFFVLVILSVPVLKNKVIKSFSSAFGSKWIFGKIAVCRFLNAVSISLSSGMDINESIDMAAVLNSNSKHMKNKFDKFKLGLTDGKSISESLKESGIISAGDSRFLSIGEVSGKTDTALKDIVRRKDEQVQNEISRIVGRIEPTLVIITSVAVGVILISVMLPLMGIMTSIG